MSDELKTRKESFDPGATGRADVTVKASPDVTVKVSPDGPLDPLKTVKQGPDGTLGPGRTGSPGGSGAPGGPALMPGKTGLANVEVVRRFPAQGGEADVYLIKQKGVERVLKHYRWGIQPKIEVLDRIINLSAQHPEYFVQVFERGYDQVSQRFYEIEEFCQHGTLRDILPSGQLGEKEVGHLCEEIARPLLVLHKNGILHLDLKPDNILVRTLDPLDVVLTDFGIASLLDEEYSKKMTDIKGTSMYQSPESLSGIVGPKSDWWSLGILLLELLQGKHPFEGLQRQVIYFRLTTTAIPIPKSLPPRWVNVLKGLLTRNPDIRWGDEEVTQWLEGAEVKTFFDEEAVKAAIEAGADADAARFARLAVPFTFLGKPFYTLEELMRAFASSPECWSQAKVLMARGQIGRWLEDNGDERGAKLTALIDAESDPDRMLFKGIYTFHAELPPAWCGRLVDKRCLLELLSKACEAGVFGEEEKLLESLFAGDLFDEYKKLTGRAALEFDDVLLAARQMPGTELARFALPERARVLLFTLNRSFVPEQALPCLQRSVRGERESELILQAASTKGFAEYMRRVKLWAKDDDSVWKLAAELLARKASVVPEALDSLVLNSLTVAAAVGRDHSLRDLVVQLGARTPFDADALERWRNLCEKHPWLADLVGKVYIVPLGVHPGTFLDNQIHHKIIQTRWPRLDDSLLPPYFAQLKEGKFLDDRRLTVVKKVLKQPGVLIPREGTLQRWSDLTDILEELPACGLEALRFEDLLEIKREYAKTIGIYNQRRFGIAGGFMCALLLWDSWSLHPLVVVSLLCFLVSTAWPHLRQMPALQRFKGKPPFEARVPDADLLRLQFPRHFNLFVKLGFLFLILRLSILHPDIVAMFGKLTGRW